jgi:hypothetical protein
VPCPWNTPNGWNVGPDKEKTMPREQLERQADRADNLADQTVDEDVKENLRAAAKEYREKAKQEAGGRRSEWKRRSSVAKSG